MYHIKVSKIICYTAHVMSAPATRDNPLVAYMLKMFNERGRTDLPFVDYTKNLVPDEINNDFRQKLHSNPPDRADYYNIVTYFINRYQDYRVEPRESLRLRRGLQLRRRKPVVCLDRQNLYDLRTHISQISLPNQKKFLKELKKGSVGYSLTMEDKTNVITVRRHLLVLLTYTWHVWHNDQHRAHKDEIDRLLRIIAPSHLQINTPTDILNICGSLQAVLPETLDLINILKPLR